MWATRKGLALVAYLAVTETVQSRDVLAGLLWPEYDQTRARANLRRTLYNLNQTPIAGWLIAEQDTVTLTRNESVLVDIQQFTYLLSPESAGGSNSKQLEDAVAAAFLPFLEGDQSETEKLIETGRLAEALMNGSITCQDLVERILKKQSSRRVLLILDQFEELFTLVPDSEIQHRFLDTLLELVFDQQFRPAPIFTLVLTLRADFLGQALAHRPLADAIQDSDVKLGPMSRQELSRAVSLPAKAAGASFEAGLFARILDDVGEEPGNLPLLEFALAGLWEQAEQGELTHQAYETIGRVDGALARYADSVLAALPLDKQRQARHIFIQLVSPSAGTEDTRRIATRAELGDDWALVPQLADARLLVTGRDPAGWETAELVHEALIQQWDQLRDWMAQDRAFRIWQERLRLAMGGWKEHDSDQSTLLRGVALATAEQWHKERPADLGDDEGAFIEASILQREQRASEKMQAQVEKERLQRRFISALSAGLALALLLAVAALL